MKTSINSLLVALVASLSITAVADAQQNAAVPVPVPRVQTQQSQSSVMPPQIQNMFYFGMSIELKRTWNGTTLRIVSVTPGSPAQLAGLEYGDEIRTVNGRGFSFASDSFQAVSMLNQFVNTNGPIAASSQAYVWPQPQPVAQMIVRNVRNGQDVFVTVRPIQRGGFPGPAPAVAAMARG